MSETDQWLANQLMSGKVAIEDAASLLPCKYHCLTCPKKNGHHWGVDSDAPVPPAGKVFLSCRHCQMTMLASLKDKDLPMV